MESYQYNTLDDAAALLTAAMRSTVESAVRQEYEEACRLAPERVAHESNYSAHLRMHDGNVYQASTRLALYWKFRKRLFGTSRWLLPMNATGRGCLNAGDLEILHSGHIILVQRNTSTPGAAAAAADSSLTLGPIMYVDHSKLPRTGGFDGTRVMFYLAHACAEQIQHPITLVYTVSSAKVPPVSFEKEILSYVSQGLPMRFSTIVVASAFEPEKTNLVATLSELLSELLRYKLGFPPLRLQGNSVAQTVLAANQVLGITNREYLPVGLGGQLDEKAYYDEWLRMRMSIEDVRDSLKRKRYTQRNYCVVGAGLEDSLARSPDSVVLLPLFRPWALHPLSSTSLHPLPSI